MLHYFLLQYGVLNNIIDGLLWLKRMVHENEHSDSGAEVMLPLSNQRLEALTNVDLFVRRNSDQNQEKEEFYNILVLLFYFRLEKLQHKRKKLQCPKKQRMSPNACKLDYTWSITRRSKVQFMKFPIGDDLLQTSFSIWHRRRRRINKGDFAIAEKLFFLYMSFHDVFVIISKRHKLYQEAAQAVCD